jgi:hypothetical protein
MRGVPITPSAMEVLLLTVSVEYAVHGQKKGWALSGYFSSFNSGVELLVRFEKG